jgi:preprotein translocase subunit SecG
MNGSPNFLDFLKNSSPIIQLAWALSAIFFIIILMLIMYLKYLRNHLREKEIITAKYQEDGLANFTCIKS